MRGYSIGYTFDALKRLTATTGAQSQNFQYDGFGNLTAKSVPAESAEPVFPGVNSAKNQLSGVPYDANGNVTALNIANLGYDMENRLTTVTTGSNTTTRKYDAANHQIEVIGPTGNDNYLFYGPNGTVLATFTLSLTPGVTWYSYFGSAWVYFGGTLLGTTGGSAGSEYSSIVDRLGTGHPGYAYGTDIGTKTGSGVLDFATYMKDSTTGFEYANQRWYSPGMGRFLTTDLYGGSASVSSPQSWNRYAYTHSDPINHTDSTGSDEDGPPDGPDPNTPPFGCDLFGGCVPGSCGATPDTNDLIGLPGGSFCLVPLLPALPVGRRPDCGEEFPISSQAEAQEIAVLFGEDSWNLPIYSYDSVSEEDLYMLQVMYNQAAASAKFTGTATGVAATINVTTYNGYLKGRSLLINTFNQSVSSNNCNHLVSAEATYSEFWDGSHELSNVNRWVSKGFLGPLQWGQIQFAGTVFYYQPNVIAPPVGSGRHPIIPLPTIPGRRGGSI